MLSASKKYDFKEQQGPYSWTLWNIRFNEVELLSEDVAQRFQMNSYIKHQKQTISGHKVSLCLTGDACYIKSKKEMWSSVGLCVWDIKLINGLCVGFVGIKIKT